MKKVTFFNTAHNGDIFATREMVRDVICQMHEYKPIYAMLKSPKLVLDICDTVGYEESISFLNGTTVGYKKPFLWENDNIAVNTWMGAWSEDGI